MVYKYLEYKKAKQDLKKVSMESVRLHRKVNKKGQLKNVILMNTDVLIRTKTTQDLFNAFYMYVQVYCTFMIFDYYKCGMWDQIARECL